MSLPPRLLFVGAHCDDVELMAGGLLARACFERRAVGILVFSDHRGVMDDAGAERARDELRANLAFLEEASGTRPEVHAPDLWLPACHGAFEAERARIYAELEAVRSAYDLVITHGAHDTNQDHQQVAREARRALKAHASLLAGEHPANDLGEFVPDAYVALDGRALDAKVRMVTRYASQRAGTRPYLEEDVVRALARVRGSQIHEQAAEAFATVRAIVR